MSAVAIDLGASSARYALGTFEGDHLDVRVIEQIEHHPKRWNGHDVWDIESLLAFCRRALDFARREGAASIGIDTWGVDHGFLGPDGRLVQPPVCYRDTSHAAIFERMAQHRDWLFAETGIQHQPFNTLYQLVARYQAQPELRAPGVRWLLLPDLLLYLLGGAEGYERSIASTTQLTDLDGQWNASVFEAFDLPQPPRPPIGPGVVGEAGGVALIRVAGHDTACAVEGLGVRAGDGTVFANVGTWALVGKVVAQPDTSAFASERNLTNERTPWNEVRLLANIPGFFILNGLHRDLQIQFPMAEWLAAADLTRPERIDTFDPALFAPQSMLQALEAQTGLIGLEPAAWAGIALCSLAEAIARRATELGAARIVLAGGGSRSDALRRLVAEAGGVPVELGPAEATVHGNLMIQRTVLESGGRA